MKTIQFSLFLMAGALLSCQQASQESTQDTTLSLPLTYVEGFGPAGFGFGVLSGEHKKEDPAGRMWVKTYLPVRGIPASWRGVKKSMVWLDSRQLVYQNYKAGNISEEEFRGLQKGWEWELNPEEFSAEPIKCYVYVVTGRDREGLLAAVIDANNNLDVSDDDVFYPKTSAMDSSLAIYTDEEKHYVDYEVFQEGKVVSRRIPMVIKRTSVAPFLYAFPQHAEARLMHKGKEYTVVVSPEGNAYFHDAKLVLTDRSKSADPSADEPVSKGELLSIGGLFDRVKYRYKGVDTYQNVLRLEAENAQEDEYSLQIGHRFQPFAATEFRSGDSIRLADFRGKYLFVDFWGTWCGGCVAELPELEKIYAGVDTSRVGFVSIAGGQDPKKLTSFLQKQPLAWPQIISDNKNKLVETYHIINYPTNVLIGPDGRVVARNLHGEVLKDLLVKVAKR